MTSCAARLLVGSDAALGARGRVLRTTRGAILVAKCHTVTLGAADGAPGARPDWPAGRRAVKVEWVGQLGGQPISLVPRKFFIYTDIYSSIYKRFLRAPIETNPPSYPTLELRAWRMAPSYAEVKPRVSRKAASLTALRDLITPLRLGGLAPQPSGLVA